MSLGELNHRKAVDKPLVVVRGFKIRDEQLYSTFANFRWEPGHTYKAQHYLGKGLKIPEGCFDPWYKNKFCPSRHTSCGFYGVKSSDRLLHLIGSSCGLTPASIVVGEIELWGRVYEHTYGYRGEYARVKRIISVPEKLVLHPKWDEWIIPDG